MPFVPQLSKLPGIVGFKRLAMSLATMDAVLCPEWQYRYYSYDSKWGGGDAMASMRDGSGDHWFALLCSSGVALVGLAHEAPSFAPGAPAPWIYRDLPESFRQNFLKEPAFDASNATYCLWCETADGVWKSGTPPTGTHDGSSEHLSILSGSPELYVKFAAEYHEIAVDLMDVQAVYDHVPLDATLVARLNPDADYSALRADLLEIGYPGDSITDP